MTIKSIESSLKRWFDIIVLSVVATLVCLFFGRFLDGTLAKFTAQISGLSWPFRFIFLAGTISIFWYIVIKAGGTRSGDLWSSSTLRYPPVWVAMLISTFAYLWMRRYVLTSNSPETPIEWSAFAIIGMAILVGIVCASIYNSILRDERKPEKKSNQKQSLFVIKNNFDTLLQVPEKLVRWFNKETPVEHPDDDYFDLNVYAHRIVANLRVYPLKTIAIVGPYGCGKSSILNMVDYYLFEEEPDELGRYNKNQYVQPSRILTCRVSSWGFHEHQIAENILSSAVNRLAKDIDCTSLTNLPSHYRSVITSTGSMWGKLTSGLFERSSDAMDVLRRMDTVLAAVDKHLVVFIEDIDRNAGNDSFWSEVISLLDRLKDLDRVSFVLAVGTNKNAVYSDILLRIAEHIEVVPPLALRQLYSLIGKFRDMCFQAFESDIACETKDTLDQRIAVYSSDREQDDRLFALLNSFQNWPLHAIAGLAMTPRIAKAMLRRTWQAWETLHGEINLDDLLVGNIIRTVSPEVFVFLNQNISRIRSLGHNATTEGRREEKERTRGKLHAEYINTLKDSQINEEAMTQLVEFLFPDWTKDGFNKPEVRQGVIRDAEPTDYWERLTKQSLDSRDISDQRVLQAITDWKSNKEGIEETLAHSLLKTEGFAKKMEQFGFLLDGNELRKLAGQLFALILSLDKKRIEEEDHAGFMELWRLTRDRPVESHEDWILSQIHRALPISLGFANNLYYYWHNTDRAMLNIEHSHPEFRKDVVADVKSFYGDNPEVFIKAVEYSPRHSLLHLVFVHSKPIHGGIGFENEDWSWLADTILKAGKMSPKTIVPQVVGFTVFVNEETRPDSFRFDQGYIQKLFLDKELQAMQLISTEFDESGLDKDDLRMVRFARQEATNWLFQKQKKEQ